MKNNDIFFHTSTGSFNLLTAGFLGVLPPRGVFVEEGVFGLNERCKSVYFWISTSIHKMWFLLTLASWSLQTEVLHHGKSRKCFRTTARKSICRTRILESNRLEGLGLKQPITEWAQGYKGDVIVISDACYTSKPLYDLIGKVGKSRVKYYRI